MGIRCASSFNAGRQFAGLRFHLWPRHYLGHLLRDLPLMILLITFAPILAAVLIMVGSPARITALIASVFTLFLTALEYVRFTPRPGAFQDVRSVSISPDLGLSFTLGLD